MASVKVVPAFYNDNNQTASAILTHLTHTFMTLHKVFSQEKATSPES